MRTLSKTLPRYFNREMSWLQFNSRVLAEAENASNPLLERLKFLAIFESNLDEFYMVRVSGLIEQEESGINERTPDGLTPTEQLALIAQEVPTLRARANDLWEKTLRGKLKDIGLHVWSRKKTLKSGGALLADYFDNHVFPVCTPMLLSPTSNFPFVSNRSLNVAVALADGDELRLARLKVPPNLGRLVPVPKKPGEFVLLEDLIGANLGSFFPGVEVLGWHMFRLVRDADVEIREIEAADLITAVQESLRLRRLGDPVLLEHESDLSSSWVGQLTRDFQLDSQDVLSVGGRIGYEFLWELVSQDRPELKFQRFSPYTAPELSTGKGIFETLARQDVLLHHPYDSFLPVEDFVSSAAHDPDVVAIKMTLYRVGPHSPVVQSLLDAAEKGKQVAAMVELKARFDESNNLEWSRALQRAGAEMTYGFTDMKVHCKLCLVVRQEGSNVRTYCHVGTGNYNPETARLYTDFGLLTSDPLVCQDVTELFNVLTGFSKQTTFRRLLVAPHNLREEIISRIERETELHKKQGGGWVAFKLNSLVDPEVIDSLYAASGAGVRVQLAVRGICCLQPSMGNGIEVVSIVGRYLEHARAFYFHNGGDPDLWIGSADMMRRNLDRRIEALVRVSDPCQIEYVRDQVVMKHFEDDRKAWVLSGDGQYRRVEPGAGFELQAHLQSHPATRDCPPN